MNGLIGTIAQDFMVSLTGVCETLKWYKDSAMARRKARLFLLI
jgi:hypothetical protein